MDLHSTQPSDIAELDIDDLLYRPGVYIVTLTPTDAARLLERNTGNRPQKKAAIDKYARQMRAGLWHLTNQGIGIDRHGVLQDGQNRLIACTRAGVPFTTALSTGLEPEARDVVDTGVKRSFGDVLRMAGHTNVANLAGAVAVRYRYEAAAANGWSWSAARNRGDQPSHEELLAYLDEHPQLADRAPRAWTVRKALGHVGLSAIVAFESMATEISPDEMPYFREALISGALLTPGDPRLLLRNNLMKQIKATPSFHQLGLMCKAWNLWVDEQTRDLLALKDTEPVQLLKTPAPQQFDHTAAEAELAAEYELVTADH